LKVVVEVNVPVEKVSTPPSPGWLEPIVVVPSLKMYAVPVTDPDTVILVLVPEQIVAVPFTVKVIFGRGLTVIFTLEEGSSEQSPLLTTALNHVSAVRLPIVAPVNVADVSAIGFTSLAKLSAEYSHLWIVPT
jgi:hypothetical protein